MGALMQYSQQIGGLYDKAENIKYDNTESGLTSTNAQGAIDELSSDLSELKNGEYVEYIASVSDTYASALLALFNLIDFSKITRNSILIRDNTAIFQALYLSSSEYEFSRIAINNNAIQLEDIVLRLNPKYRYIVGSAYTDASSNPCSSTFRVYYC